MQENFIRNIALLCSAAGLVLLFFVSGQIERVEIGSITIDDIGREVRVCGDIGWKQVSNNHVFMGIADGTGDIKLVVFNTTALRLNSSGVDVYGFSKWESICSNGVVDEYPKGSGELELIYRRGDIGRV